MSVYEKSSDWQMCEIFKTIIINPLGLSWKSFIPMCFHSHKRLLSIGLNLLSHSSLIICIVAFLCSLILSAGNEKYFNAWKEIKSFIFFDAKCQISFCLFFVHCWIYLVLLYVMWKKNISKTQNKNKSIEEQHCFTNLFCFFFKKKVQIYSSEIENQKK